MQELKDDELERAICVDLARERRINLHRDGVAVTVRGHRVTLEGQVSTISAKRLAIELAARRAGIGWVDDRLRLLPSEPMGDGAIRDHVRDALLGESAFARHGLQVMESGRPVTVRAQPPEPDGEILLQVAEGEVTLEGRVLSRSHLWLAGVLAWWVPGSVQVHNHLVPTPWYDEHDTDGELEELVRIVLEKDRLVNSDQILVRSGDACVTLTGSVPSRQQRDIAEHDVWFVEGVRELVNELSVP